MQSENSDTAPMHYERVHGDYMIEQVAPDRYRLTCEHPNHVGRTYHTTEPDEHGRRLGIIQCSRCHTRSIDGAHPGPRTFMVTEPTWEAVREIGAL